MNIPNDIVLHILQFLQLEANLYAKLVRVSRQFNELCKTDDVWRKIFFQKYPTAKGTLTHNFKWAYGEMAKFQKTSFKKDVQNGEMKLIMLGQGGVGKSAFVVQFVMATFIGEYDPTIEDCYRKQIDFYGTPLVLDILDTAGPEEYTCMLDQYVKSAHGFLVMFALNDKRSLRDAEYYIERVHTWTDSGKKPMILVGNKKDLCETERQVHPKEIQELANKYNIPCTMEASGKTAENVQNAFFTLAEMAYCSYTELFAKLEKGKSIVADEKKKKCSVM